MSVTSEMRRSAAEAAVDGWASTHRPPGSWTTETEQALSTASARRLIPALLSSTASGEQNL